MDILHVIKTLQIKTLGTIIFFEGRQSSHDFQSLNVKRHLQYFTIDFAQFFTTELEVIAQNAFSPNLVLAKLTYRSSSLDRWSEN